MKETVKINLGQRLFDLDADAYDALKKYLDSLKQYFKKSPDEADEILQDIEQRMADILEEKSGNSKQVVTLEDITNLINMMGTAEEFDSGGDNMEEHAAPINDEKEAFPGTNNKNRHRLYRDIENNIFGGVCRGIAAYFNIDPIWVRLAWVLLFFLKGIGLLAYLILWLVVPAARTTAQKLEMNGIPVNIENIEQAVKDEFKKVKENLRNFHRSDGYSRTQNALAEMFNVVGRICLVFLKVFLVLAGVILALIGIGLIVGLITISSFGFHHLYMPDMPFLYYFRPYLQSSPLFALALFLVILIPVFGIFIGFIKFIFNVRTHHHILSAFAWVIWIIALILVILSVASGGKILSDRYKTVGKNKLNMKSQKILYLSFNDESLAKDDKDLFNFFGKEFIHDKYERKYYLQPSIQIESSNDSAFYLKVERTLSIPLSNRDDELDKLAYRWTFHDSALILNTKFDVDQDEIWQLPKVQLTLLVPEGKKLRIEHERKHPFVSEGSISDNFPREYYNKVLIMKNGKLQEALK